MEASPSSNLSKNLNVTAIAATPALYPTPRPTITPRVLRTPSVLVGKQSTKVNRPLACGLFIFYPARALDVGPYANSSELSYTTILTYTTDTILPGLG